MVIDSIIDKLFEATIKERLIWEKPDRSFFSCEWVDKVDEVNKRFSIQLHRQVSHGVEYMVLDIMEMSYNHRNGFSQANQAPIRKFSTGLVPNSSILRGKLEKLYDTIWDMSILKDLARSDNDGDWITHMMTSMSIKLDKADKQKFEEHKTKYKEDGKN